MNNMRSDDVRDGWSRTSMAITFFFCLAVLLAGGFLVRAWALGSDRVLGLAEENVKTHNFEESQAYRQGIRQDFDNLLLQYTRAKDPGEKAAILSVIRHRAGDCPSDQVPSVIRDLLRGAQ
jgi:hypothetical protein